MVVGLWPEGEAAFTDVSIQRAVGADLYVGSLGKAVEGIQDELGSREAGAATVSATPSGTTIAASRPA